MTIEGKATSEGTGRYASRFESIAPGHFRNAADLWISSIGLGTYLGELDDETDRSYQEAVVAAFQNGCNLIDSAVNYRFQRSERNIGAALKEAIDRGIVARDEIVLSTKGGFMTPDHDYPPNPARYFQEQYYDKGICSPEEVVANCHCMTPGYLQDQLQRSLTNMGVDCVDIYFIHNPETQLSGVTRQDFLKRMLAAFKMLEEQVQAGKIQYYGTATWDGYRAARGSRGYLSLEELIGLARSAGSGDNHHFRVLQLPYNLAMPEAFLSNNQNFGSAAVPLLEAAKNQEFIVMSSASILQGKLSDDLPESIREFFKELKTDAQRSIQFARSTPGVTSALVGMSRKKHVVENLETARHSPLEWNQFKELFE